MRHGDQEKESWNEEKSSHHKAAAGEHRLEYCRTRRKAANPTIMNHTAEYKGTALIVVMFYT